MAKATVLSRDAILRTAVLKRRTITVDALDGDVLVREMSGLEAAHFQKRSLDVIKPNNGGIKSAEALARLNASVLINGVINEDGSAVFSNDDAGVLMDMPSSVLETIANEILDISGLTAGGRRRAEKNSMPNGGSGSG